MYKVAKLSFTAHLLDLALQTKMTLEKVILLLELFSYHMQFFRLYAIIIRQFLTTWVLPIALVAG